MGRLRFLRNNLAGAGLGIVVGLTFTLATTTGCGNPLRFPAAPLAVTPGDGGASSAYDTDGDKQPDYFTTQDASGRIVRIAYDLDRDGKPDSPVNLDEIAPANARQVVLILDGIGYETVEAFRREGHLRLFHPPARVISTFPAMTDLALADVFQSVRCIGLETVYFDHQANQLTGSDNDYVSLKNEDWARRVDYRADVVIDPLSYLFPNAMFNQELTDLLACFDRRDRPRIVAYLVSTAGMGTRGSLAGQRKVLDTIDRLCEELVWKTRGLVKITILSDHGHSLVESKRTDFRAFLPTKGWRVVDRLEKPRDVACVEYGLVTYASFATRDRAALAADLITHPGVDVVAYDEGDAVVVVKGDAKARIERRGDRYRYRPESGDPLGLLPLVEKSRAAKAAPAPAGQAPATLDLDADGFASDRAWLAVTLTHDYPDPLDRLWRAFHGQSEHVPDVMASLRDGYCAGMASRAFWLPRIASTHGDLERKSATAFILSTSGPVAEKWPLLRSRDLPTILPELTGRPWPPARAGDGK